MATEQSTVNGIVISVDVDTLEDLRANYKENIKSMYNDTDETVIVDLSLEDFCRKIYTAFEKDIFEFDLKEIYVDKFFIDTMFDNFTVEPFYVENDRTGEMEYVLPDFAWSEKYRLVHSD